MNVCMLISFLTYTAAVWNTSYDLHLFAVHSKYIFMNICHINIVRFYGNLRNVLGITIWSLHGIIFST